MKHMNATTEMESIVLTGATTYELRAKTVREVYEGFNENIETGQVTGFGGNLDIRPAYQREYVYGRKAAQAVIETILKGAPLSNMYWVDLQNGQYELLDGQQRTISICQFVDNQWTVKIEGNDTYFKNLHEDQKKQILNYKLQVYEIRGKQSDVIRWFTVINQPNSPLTAQEIRNSVYTGTWLTSAKSYFSNPQGGAANRYGYLTGGDAKRQEILETALVWIAGEDGITLYMAEHQFDENADQLKEHFKAVCEWVENVTGGDEEASRVKLGKQWGELYNKYHDTFVINREEIDEEIDRLCKDREVNDKPKGFYPYIISGDVKCLTQRQFKRHDKEAKFREQKGVCPVCGKVCTLKEMEADHIKPYSDGGLTVYENLQMLCSDCNQRKGNGTC